MKLPSRRSKRGEGVVPAVEKRQTQRATRAVALAGRVADGSTRDGLVGKCVAEYMRYYRQNLSTYEMGGRHQCLGVVVSDARPHISFGGPPTAITGNRSLSSHTPPHFLPCPPKTFSIPATPELPSFTHHPPLSPRDRFRPKY